MVLLDYSFLFNLFLNSKTFNPAEINAPPPLTLKVASWLR